MQPLQFVLSSIHSLLSIIQKVKFLYRIQTNTILENKPGIKKSNILFHLYVGSRTGKHIEKADNIGSRDNNGSHFLGATEWLFFKKHT